MINREFIGHTLPESVLDIERGRLKFFAKAIGETNPVYFDESAAHAAGYVDLPAPPTFLFSADLDSGGLEQMLQMLKVDMNRVLHGEQEFSYSRIICAGERITVRSKIADIYDKKNGALEFVVKQSQAFDVKDEVVAELRCVLVIRN
ncbi:MAG: MaoC family dehydratase N-terminal domain-containing protein [Pseudomonadota bacterium]